MNNMNDINDEPVQINFRIFKEYRYLFENCVHSNKSFFDSIIQQHECFIEIQNKYPYNKYNKKPQYPRRNNTIQLTQKKKERTKIGNRDMSKESIIKKDFQAILNKITENNIEKLIKQTNNIVDIKYINIILELIYQYLLLQSNFQHLYILLLNGIYNNSNNSIQDNIKQFWIDKFNNYLSNQEWNIDEKILEETENYDNFCYSIKIKKERVSLISSWARLKNNNLLDNKPEYLFSLILDNCFSLDMNNLIHRNIIDNYIEQLKEYYNTISEDYRNIINNMYNKQLNKLIDYNLPKISYFKLLEFLELIN